MHIVHVATITLHYAYMFASCLVNVYVTLHCLSQYLICNKTVI